jgi:hypothetical protein
MSSDDAVTFIKDAGSAGFSSLDLIPADIHMALEFSIDFAEKFSDDAVLSSDDAVSAGFALVLTLASSYGFRSIFFVGLVNVAIVDFVNVAMDDLAKISFCFVS